MGPGDAYPVTDAYSVAKLDGRANEQPDAVCNACNCDCSVAGNGRTEGARADGT